MPPTDMIPAFDLHCCTYGLTTPAAPQRLWLYYAFALFITTDWHSLPALPPASHTHARATLLPPSGIIHDAHYLAPPPPPPPHPTRTPHPHPTPTTASHSLTTPHPPPPPIACLWCGRCDAYWRMSLVSMIYKSPTGLCCLVWGHAGSAVACNTWLCDCRVPLPYPHLPPRTCHFNIRAWAGRLPRSTDIILYTPSTLQLLPDTSGVG